MKVHQTPRLTRTWMNRHSAAMLLWLVMAAVMLAGGCRSMTPGAEKPVVNLRSFKPLPGAGGLPNFEIGLGIINPNREALELHGIVYSIRVQGHDLVKGVGKDFPTVEGYSEANITLVGQPNLLAGIRMISDLMAHSPGQLKYEFEARLDTGGWSIPIRVRDAGSFDLSGQQGERYPR